MAETFAQAYASRANYRGRSDDDAAAWVFGIARH
jgi:DNA-directed RNA polymerase specialized sigma24 family protein